MAEKLKQRTTIKEILCLEKNWLVAVNSETYFSKTTKF